MTDALVLGMPLEGGEDIGQPAGALVVVKGLDKAGNLSYWPLCTEGIMTVEAIGMAILALDRLRAGLAGGMPPA